MPADEIGGQINNLQKTEYFQLKNPIKDNYPNTTLSLTDKGRKAFETYVSDLKKYINPGK
jgi:hypothetical protein